MMLFSAEAELSEHMPFQSQLNLSFAYLLDLRVISFTEQ